ncbi:MAG: DUF1598 domain-containing protein [Pirellulales bacterium]|nr:DUF1598 domain-containing protein [Pirellulales bacterium]
MSTARRDGVRAGGRRGAFVAQHLFRFAAAWVVFGAGVFGAVALQPASFVQAWDELPAALDEQLAEHLAAGAWDQATKLANEAPRARRDRLLAKIAVAQAGAGQRQRFADTLDAITATDVRMQAARDGRREILAQFPALQGQGDAPGLGRQGGVNGGPQGLSVGNSGSNFGGGQDIDFDPLMELITSTVAPTTWEDVGGPGTVRPFITGVWVDTTGLMTRLKQVEAHDAQQLAAIRVAARAAAGDRADDAPRRASPLRMVSLARLERHVLHQLAAGEPLDEAALVLAGIRRVQFVLVFTAEGEATSGDIVLAGPAGDWLPSPGGRFVAADTGRPVVRLDDLVVLLRRLALGEQGTLGCSIVPRTAGLQAAQQFLSEAGQRPLAAGRQARERWIEQLRSKLGLQTIEFYGLPVESHVARVLIEADYHMKLVGTGLAEGTPAVPSYLELVERSGEVPESLDVLRWWFTLKYTALKATADRQAFAIDGPAAQVLSESELLDAQGQRIHTGKSDPLNSEFARRFTADFAALAERYPVYAELQNVFDLAMVAAVIRHEQLEQAAQFDFGCLADEDLLALPRFAVPAAVETVANHRQLDGRRFVAVVSGGVRLDPYGLLASVELQADNGTLAQQRAQAAPRGATWWWDADSTLAAAEDKE